MAISELLRPGFQSPLASLMEQFVQTKQACGYRFGEGTRMLRRFDRYLSAEGLLRCELPRPLTRQWLAKQPHESARAVPHLPGAPVRRVSVPPRVLRLCPRPIAFGKGQQ